MNAARGVARLLPATPEARTMAFATLANTIGNGMFMVVSVLYFSRIVGLSPESVGLGLTIAGLCGLVVGVPLGHLGDRVGPRELLIRLLLVSGVVFCLVTLANSWWSFVLVVSAGTVLDRGSAAVRSGLIATSVHGAERIRTRAYLRSIANIGLAVGAALAGIALHFDSRTAYVVVLLANGATCWVAALVLRAYPHVRPIPRSEGVGITHVFRDRPYVLMTVLIAAMAIQYSILDVGVPLWVVRETSAPRVMISVLFVINTAVVVLFQVAVSRRVESVRTAARVIAASGLVFFGACAAFAWSHDQSPRWAIVILVIAGLTHVLGELLQAAGHFCLSQELAPDHAQGQYQGLTSTGLSLSLMLAPSVIVLLPIGMGVLGWWILGGIFVLLGLLLVPVVRWTVSTRWQFSHA
ncbi:MAG: MFS transporter [Nocardioidaceae bacterium]